MAFLSKGRVSGKKETIRIKNIKGGMGDEIGTSKPE